MHSPRAARPLLHLRRQVVEVQKRQGLLRNPANLTERQRATLDGLSTRHLKTARAYLLRRTAPSSHSMSRDTDQPQRGS